MIMSIIAASLGLLTFVGLAAMARKDSEQVRMGRLEEETFERR
jgi:hypothetical protein